MPGAGRKTVAISKNRRIFICKKYLRLPSANRSVEHDGKLILRVEAASGIVHARAIIAMQVLKHAM